MLLPPWSADPGLLQPGSAASSRGMQGRDEWRRPAAFAQIISSKAIWEVALATKKSDSLGKYLGPLPLSQAGSQQPEADVWGWSPEGFQSTRVKDPPSLCREILLSISG